MSNLSKITEAFERSAHKDTWTLAGLTSHFDQPGAFETFEFKQTGFVTYVLNPRPLRWWNRFIAPPEEKVQMAYGHIKARYKEGWNIAGSGPAPHELDALKATKRWQQIKDIRVDMFTVRIEVPDWEKTAAAAREAVAAEPPQ